MKSTWLSVAAVLLLSGCSQTMEERKAVFAEEMRPQIGVQTKDFYLHEWGSPANREMLKDDGEALTWEWRTSDGREGWQKTLIFSPQGVLVDYRWTHWPRK